MDTRNAKDLIVFIVYIIIINVTEIKEMPSEIVNEPLGIIILLPPRPLTVPPQLEPSARGVDLVSRLSQTNCNGGLGRQTRRFTDKVNIHE